MDVLLVESCRNVDCCVSLVLIALYTAVVSAENNLAFVTTSVCRRTLPHSDSIIKLKLSTTLFLMLFWKNWVYRY